MMFPPVGERDCYFDDVQWHILPDSKCWRRPLWGHLFELVIISMFQESRPLRPHLLKCVTTNWRVWHFWKMNFLFYRWNIWFQVSSPDMVLVALLSHSQFSLHESHWSSSTDKKLELQELSTVQSSFHLRNAFLQVLEGCKDVPNTKLAFHLYFTILQEWLKNMHRVFSPIKYLFCIEYVYDIVIFLWKKVPQISKDALSSLNDTRIFAEFNEV